MLALNLIVRAVIVHEGRLLLTVLNDGVRAPFLTLLGGHVDLGESLTQAVAREVREEVGLSVAPSRLLYVVENWFHRGSSKLHELGFYFLCHPVVPIEGELLDALEVSQAELISPELLTPEELPESSLEPAALRTVLRDDVLTGFSSGPRLIVVNELPGDSGAVPGVYTI